MQRVAVAARVLVAVGILGAWGCERRRAEPRPADPVSTGSKAPAEPGPAGGSGFEHVVERFDDVQILRYEVRGFDSLPLNQKLLLYYLYEAALSGRDIVYDQNYQHNLAVRRTLEAVLSSERARRLPSFGALEQFAKHFFFSNGLHHHDTGQKLKPRGLTIDAFAELVKAAEPSALPLEEEERAEDLIQRLGRVLFDPKLDAVSTQKGAHQDPVGASAVNFYRGVTTAQVRAFHKAKKDADPARPVSHGLNSRLEMGPNDKPQEKVFMIEGLYGPALARAAEWLERAAGIAENAEQRRALEALVQFYRSGDLRDFDAYNVAWVKDTDSSVDLIHGFIETYDDPLGYRGTYESVVQLRDEEATRRMRTLSEQAQWFEEHSPIDAAHKKEKVVGISARVIQAVVEAGRTAPRTPVGINLPNSSWIREQHGSKSVTLGNIVRAYDAATRDSGALEELAMSTREVRRAREHGALARTLLIDMHEVIGHASGRLNPGVAPPSETLREYAATLEEARADLVALYYMLDPHLIELRLMPSLEVGRAAYDAFIRNALVGQLRRVPIGEGYHEDHMRDRALIARWAYERGMKDAVIEKVTRDGKTYFVIRNYVKLRSLFGQLLREIQRIKSEGDHAAGKALVEDYGTRLDPALHGEVLRRFEQLNIPRYRGFVQPRLVPVKEGDAITDVRLEYPRSFLEEQLRLGKDYALLPVRN